MKKLFKWLLGIVLLLVLLVVAAVFAIPYLVDPNEYKDEIIAQAKPYMMGRDLKIPGKIKISIVPWLGFEMGEVVIGNAEGFVLKPFATIKQSRAHIKVWPLLFKKIEVDSVEINGLVVNLQRDAEGRDNWSDLAGNKTDPNLRKVSNKPATGSDKPLELPDLQVKGLHFGDARINFDDRQGKTDITISKLDIDAGPINQLNPIPISAKFNYHSQSQGIAAASAMATSLVLTPATKHVQLDQFIINTNVSGKTLSNQTVATSLNIPALKIDLAAEKVEAKPFHLKVDQYQSEGRFTLTKFSKPIIRFGLDMKELDLDKILPQTQAAAAKAETAPATSKDAGAGKAVFAPLLAFKTADMQGTIKINKLRVRKLDIQNLNLNVLARGGLVSALPEASLYDGTYKGDVQIQIRTLPATLRTKHELRDVQFGPIVEALTGKPTLTGKARIQGQFFSDGHTMDDLIRNLNGDAQFNIRNADLKLVDAEKMVLGKWHDKLKLDQKQDPKKEVTVFDSIRGSIRVKGGVAYNKDLSGVSRRVNLTGTGHAILFKQEIDYTLYTTFKKSLALSVGGSSYDLKDKKIPTHIRGNWNNPEIDNDLEAVLKGDLVGSKLDRQKSRLEDKVKSEKEKLRDKLKNMFSR